MRYKSFKEFYPYYLSQHQNITCKRLHFIGTLLTFVIFIFGLFVQDIRYWGLIPIIGYGFAWTGHYFFEKNKPATFRYFLYSLRADYLMFYHILIKK